MQINELKLKLGGVANLSKELELTKNYDLIIKNAEVRKSEDLPNDDGLMDRQFTVKISELSEIQIIGDREAIGAKKKGSQAKLLRFEIQQRADELGENRESFYIKEMTKIINKYKNESEEEAYRATEDRETS